MHDTHLFKNIIRYFGEQEAARSSRLKKAYFSISEFGSLDKDHFLEHYQQAVSGTKFEGVQIALNKVAFGPELEITGLEFEAKTKGQ